MSVLFTTDFESDTTGSLPAGWTADVGTWAVMTTNPPSGTKSLGTTTPADGNRLRRSGNVAQGYTRWQVDYLNMGDDQAYAPMVRVSADGASGYLLQVAPTGGKYGLQLWRADSGTFTNITGVTLTGSGTATIGDVVHVEFIATGTTLEGRMWINGGARPSAAMITMTDGTYATGQVSVRYTQSTNRGASGFDGALLQDNGGVTVSGTAGNGTIGVAYSQRFTASGGTPPYTFTVGSGSLPPGTSLVPFGTSAVDVSGTPSSLGTSNFVIHAVDNS